MCGKLKEPAGVTDTMDTNLIATKMCDAVTPHGLGIGPATGNGNLASIGTVGEDESNVAGTPNEIGGRFARKVITTSAVVVPKLDNSIELDHKASMVQEADPRGSSRPVVIDSKPSSTVDDGTGNSEDDTSAGSAGNGDPSGDTEPASMTRAGVIHADEDIVDAEGNSNPAPGTSTGNGNDTIASNVAVPSIGSATPASDGTPTGVTLQVRNPQSTSTFGTPTESTFAGIGVIDTLALLPRTCTVFSPPRYPPRLLL